MAVVSNNHRTQTGGPAVMDSAVVRCLDLLWAVAEHGEPMTIRQVMDATGMSRATAYRTLEHLQSAGWLTVDGWPRRYRASIRLAQLGLQALHHNRVREVTLSQAINCARATQRMCVVAFYDAGDAAYTDFVTVTGDRVTLLPTGTRVPAPCSAIGKILLAYQGDEEVERVAHSDIPPFTARTQTDPEAILEEIRAARRQGFATSDREYTEIGSAIACPVFGSGGGIVAGMSLHFVNVPITDAVVQRYLDTLVSFSSNASAELGYRAIRYAGIG
jgi:DNA-binding IclR family transcriptional regulator